MKKRIVTIGGGSGHFNLLSALNKLDHQITSVCPITDSGGSTGILKEEYADFGVNGFLGDAGKCLLALGNEKVTQELKYKFTQGPFVGHSLKNILFSGLIAQADYPQALEKIKLLLDISEENFVWPVSFDQTTLNVKMGEVTISGETYIDKVDRMPFWNPKKHPIKKIWLEPQVKISKQVSEAIEKADYILIAPGDLFTSILPVLLVGDMKEVFAKNQAKIILFVNLMTKRGETDGFSAFNIIEWIEKTIDKKIDLSVCNSAEISTDIKELYKSKEGKDPICLPHEIPIERKDGITSFDMLGSDQEGHVIHDPQKIEKFLKDYIK